jgi:hypothetical protein
MEDLGALLDSHQCAGGQCTRDTHTQVVQVSAADVATTADELHTLAAVRDCLSEHGFRMLETVPTPRFEDGVDSESKPWPIVYDHATALFTPGSVSEPLRLSLWPFRRRR